MSKAVIYQVFLDLEQNKHDIFLGKKKPHIDITCSRILKIKFMHIIYIEAWLYIFAVTEV